MGELWNKTRNKKIFDKLAVADDPSKRMKGLLGRTELEKGEGLYIKGDTFMPANFVHTFFMKFAIDLIFVDRELQVVALKENVKPWRLCMPVLKAHGVVEGPAGIAREYGIEVGDKLNVVS